MTARRGAGWRRERERLSGREVLGVRTQAGPLVRVVPMPGFALRSALLVARFGSLDTHLADGRPLPDGTAHFLEHKMFQSEEGDLFDVYARRGASANAYTTFGHTTYLFGATRRFDENLETLLGSLASITTDDASIARERGIIGQEIAMYADDPGWRGWFGLLEALFVRHPVRRDIAGTAESIAAIDRPLLERVFETGYAPANLVLCVAGDVDPDAVRATTERVLGGRPRGRSLRRRPVAEPRRLGAPEARVRLSVKRPQVWWGLKDRPPPRGRRARHRREALTRLGLEALFGDGGRVQAPLYEEGIADESLAAAYECEAGAAWAVVQAEVDDEAAWRARLRAETRRALAAGLGPAEVERARRRLLGRLLRTFDAPDRTAHWLEALALRGEPVNEAADLLRAARPGEVNRRLRELFACPAAFSVVAPRAGARRRRSTGRP